MPKVDKEFLNKHYNEIDKIFKIYGLHVFVHFEKRNIVFYVKNELNQDFDISNFNNYFTDLCNKYNYINNIKIVNTKLFGQVIQPHEDSIEFEKIKDNMPDECQAENSSKSLSMFFDKGYKSRGDNNWIQPNNKISPISL